MLVLTRKLDEEILIGEDIKVTLIRVRGNTVRIGIEAPRDVRIVRGELERIDETQENDGSLSERELAFAHPPTSQPKQRATRTTSQGSIPQNRLPQVDSVTNVSTPTEPKLYSGSVTRSGEAKLSRAPLAGFVAAS